MFKIYPGGKLSWQTMLEMMLSSKQKKKHLLSVSLIFHVQYKLQLTIAVFFTFLLFYWHIYDRIKRGGSCLFLSLLWSASTFSITRMWVGCPWTHEQLRRALFPYLTWWNWAFTSIPFACRRQVWGSERWQWSRQTINHFRFSIRSLSLVLKSFRHLSHAALVSLPSWPLFSNLLLLLTIGYVFQDYTYHFCLLVKESPFTPGSSSLYFLDWVSSLRKILLHTVKIIYLLSLCNICPNLLLRNMISHSVHLSTHPCQQRTSQEFPVPMLFCYKDIVMTQLCLCPQDDCISPS